MATPFEDWLRMQGGSMLPPPRPSAPAPPPFATSPYLTPQQRGATGLPFGSLLGTEMPGSAPVPPAPATAPAPRAAPAPTAAPMGGGFAPAMQTLPRQIERGREPFDDFLTTYNMGRTPAQQDPLAAMRQPAQEQAAPFFLSAQPGQQVRGQGGQGASQMDPAQMQREQMLAQRYPRAMGRIQQLRAVAQRRGY